MKENYMLQLNIEIPQQIFNSLDKTFEVLKKNKHIVIYSFEPKKKKYMRLVTEENVDPSKYPFYIQTSTEAEGVFVPDVEFWVENYMLEAFYYPDKMPYIEKLA